MVQNIGSLTQYTADIRAHQIIKLLLLTEKVLERGEKIELLVDRTDRLNQQAFKFEKQSKKLKNAMWWRNIRMMVAIGVVVGVRLALLPLCNPFD